MRDSCYSLTGGPRGRCSPSGMSGYFKWCHMCQLVSARARTAPPRAGHGPFTVCQEQRGYPAEHHPVVRKMRDRVREMGPKSSGSPLTPVRSVLCCAVHGEPPQTCTGSLPMAATACSVSFLLICFVFYRCSWRPTLGIGVVEVVCFWPFALPRVRW